MAVVHMLTISAILDCQFAFDRCFGVHFDFLLLEVVDHGYCIKFCIKNEIKCERTFEMLTVAFGESTMSRTQVQLRCNRFKEGREDINDDAQARQQPMKTMKQ